MNRPDAGWRPPSPQLRRVWRVGWLLFLGLLLLAALLVLVVLSAPRWAYGASFAATIGLMGASWPWTDATWRARRYCLGDVSVDLRHGVVVRHASTVPYHRIQQIDLRRGPVERHYAMSTLVLRTAAATTDARLPGLPEAEAAELRVLLLSRAGITDAV